MDSDAFLDALWQYGTVFGLLVAAGFGFPMPEELPVAMGGVMAGHASGKEGTLVYWWVMLPLCMLGVVLSDCALYFIGRKWGPKLLDKAWVQRVLPTQKQQHIRENFHQYGIWILLIARLTPGFRTPVFMMAGITKMPVSRFLLADGLYAIPGVTVIFSLGYWFGDQFIDLVKRVGEYKDLVILALIAFGSGVGAGWYLAKRNIATGDPKEIPLVGMGMDRLIHPTGNIGISSPEITNPPAIESPDTTAAADRDAPSAARPTGGMEPSSLGVPVPDER